MFRRDEKAGLGIESFCKKSSKQVRVRYRGKVERGISHLCLFVWGLSSHSRILHSLGDVTITGEGLQMLTYIRPHWTLRSEGSLPCYTFCDKGQPFILVVSEDPWHAHVLPSVWQWICPYLFWRIRSVFTGDRTPISRLIVILYQQIQCGRQPLRVLKDERPVTFIFLVSLQNIFSDSYMYNERKSEQAHIPPRSNIALECCIQWMAIPSISEGQSNGNPVSNDLHKIIVAKGQKGYKLFLE